MTPSEANYREVFDKANDGFLIHDMETGQILDANRKICDMYGYTLGELRQLEIGLISSNEPPFTSKAARENIRRASQGVPQLFEWVAKAKDGTLFWVEVNLKKVGIGGQDRLLAIVRDISERKRADEEKQRLQEALAQMSRLTTLGELAASLAHELNQPLTAILTNSQAALRIMRAEDFDPGEIREILGDIVLDDKRAGDVIRRMRDLLKHRRTAVQCLEVEDLIAEVYRLVRSDAFLAHTTLETRIQSGLPSVVGDRVQLQQVILNLVMNALHALRGVPTSRRRLTVIALREGERSVRIEISDTGPGIPESMQPVLFEPFSTTKPHGLGLGLAICRTLVEAHDGKIWAESGPEPGARLIVLLPASRQAKV
ncbi:MAG: ATP-binding protein [Actinobacteria bacterium]|nr:ATP-binding protein [Actinomycetota bacterium]